MFHKIISVELFCIELLLGLWCLHGAFSNLHIYSNEAFLVRVYCYELSTHQLGWSPGSMVCDNNLVPHKYCMTSTSFWYLYPSGDCILVYRNSTPIWMSWHVLLHKCSYLATRWWSIFHFSCGKFLGNAFMLNKSATVGVKDMQFILIAALSEVCPQACAWIFLLFPLLCNLKSYQNVLVLFHMLLSADPTAQMSCWYPWLCLLLPPVI